MSDFVIIVVLGELLHCNDQAIVLDTKKIIDDFWVEMRFFLVKILWLKKNT